MPHCKITIIKRSENESAVSAAAYQSSEKLFFEYDQDIPREIPSEQYADLIRDYCREFFVSKGMIADFAIHDKRDGTPTV